MTRRLRPILSRPALHPSPLAATAPGLRPQVLQRRCGHRRLPLGREPRLHEQDADVQRVGVLHPPAQPRGLRNGGVHPRDQREQVRRGRCRDRRRCLCACVRAFVLACVRACVRRWFFAVVAVRCVGNLALLSPLSMLAIVGLEAFCWMVFVCRDYLFTYRLTRVWSDSFWKGYKRCEAAPKRQIVCVWRPFRGHVYVCIRKKMPSPFRFVVC